MFKFFKKKLAADAPPQDEAPDADTAEPSADAAAGGLRGWIDRLRGAPAETAAETPPASTDAAVPLSAALQAPAPVPATTAPPPQVPAEPSSPPPDDDEEPVSPRLQRWLGKLGFGAEEPPAPPGTAVPDDPAPWTEQDLDAAALAATPADEDEASDDDRTGWLDRLRGGLRKTGAGLVQVFTGTRIDEALYEELEDALLMADAGVKATQHLLADLRRRVKEARATDPAAVKALLVDAIADLLAPLEKALEVGRESPTVMMVVGVNGAGKTTTIGKLTRHLADARQKVLLAAADTFRAAAREQLAVWAGRNRVEIVSQQGGDPAAVTFDAVVAGKARGCDVVIADTAGRLTTQAHLMEELKKIRRTIAKAQAGAPHEVLLVVDGNTGQNALTQVQAFDAALGLTGLIVTKLDGTAKGGVLAAIALWSRERGQTDGHAPVPVYFIGVGEKLEDLQTFSAREFALALLG